MAVNGDRLVCDILGAMETAIAAKNFESIELLRSILGKHGYIFHDERGKLCFGIGVTTIYNQNGSTSEIVGIKEHCLRKRDDGE